MNTHKNAPLTPEGRARMVRAVVVEGHTQTAVARMFRTSRKTVGKWVRRYRDLGVGGLLDRSSSPKNVPNRTPEQVRERIVALRQTYRLSSPELAEVTGVPRSTVGRWLRRAGLGRLRSPKPDEPARRYERQEPGDLLHVDIKKLARFQAIGHRITGNRSQAGRTRGGGYDHIHVAIDDHSRLAYVEVLADEKAATATAFLRRALAWYASHGITVQRLMSDNGPCYRSKAFNELLREQGIRHIYTRPYTPRTNGKAERFIGLMTHKWAYAQPYPNSEVRNQLLSCWMRFYNERRPHGSLGRRPPITRVPGYNVVSNYI